MKTNAIIAAGGISQRFGKNKLFEPLGKSNIIMQTLKKFVENDKISRIIVAIKSEYVDELISFFKLYKIDDKKVRYAQAGDTRSQSVENAFISLEDDCKILLVHDAARPFVSAELIDKVIDEAQKSGAAIPCVKLTDSIISADSFPMSQRREGFRLVQTPQAFDTQKLLQAYAVRTRDFTDDFSVYETYGGGVATLIEGEIENIKITTPDDIKKVQTGCGYDIHRLVSGDSIMIGGVKIAHNKKFEAHSDGDVLLHSLMDALLSAVGEKDIGHHFPSSDEQYKDISSLILLDKVLSIVKEKGFRVSNVSFVVIAQTPLLSPYIDSIRQSIADALDIARQNVGLSASTNEKIDTIGNEEAIACFATVLLANYNCI